MACPIRNSLVGQVSDSEMYEQGLYQFCKVDAMLEIEVKFFEILVDFLVIILVIIYFIISIIL